MDERVQGDGRAELPVLRREPQQVPLAELHPRVAAAARLDHAGGQVDPDRARSAPGEQVRHVPGTAAEVGDRPARLRPFQQAGQQRPVERLARELVVQPLRVLLGHGVVGTAHGRVSRELVPVFPHAPSIPPLARSAELRTHVLNMFNSWLWWCPHNRGAG